ncbi:MAG: hypothetical protein KatS3mg105_2611 [Gemmatales bacterium]|nr:MAG: hypothetical protein KatS3mg105_2611 [Gemmatales bacterium]
MAPPEPGKEFDRDHVAVVQLTRGTNSGDVNNPFKADDPRLIWEIENVDREGKPVNDRLPRAAFFPVDGAMDNTGLQVRLYGIKEGRIKLTIRLQGNEKPIEFIEMQVVQQKYIPYRIQSLRPGQATK